MDERIKRIYGELYEFPRKKKYFAKLFDKTEKTIENTINKYPDEIIFDREIGSYRFKDLLPKYIPYETFFKIFQESISNQILKQDFIGIGKSINLQPDNVLPMIRTSILSSLAQKIIMGEVAINSNCVLRVDYTGNAKPLETKYIRPHKIISTGYTYYLYCSYDDRNNSDVGANRSLAFNGISGMKAVDYVKNDTFKIHGIGNAYGIIDKEKFVTLKLVSSSAGFFKREGLFKQENYDFVTEEVDGAVIIKMYYNNIQEVVKLLQQWMPQISIYENDQIKNEVYNTIERNFDILMKNTER